MEMGNGTVILYINVEELWENDFYRQLYVASWFSAVSSFRNTAMLKLDRTTYNDIVRKFKNGRKVGAQGSA
jgi:hypothetical protein